LRGSPLLCRGNFRKSQERKFTSILSLPTEFTQCDIFYVRGEIFFKRTERNLTNLQLKSSSRRRKGK
jgi:hypothetical protein